ncbi:MAG TPA: TrmH family RNA methyltransferase [Polyangiales bacterium]|jgi:tRNA G18 (ribose-2'-O)-methylase SpoU|nr:TrmH family RNA methyltransferase [Polyangiales bacterium]
MSPSSAAPRVQIAGIEQIRRALRERSDVRVLLIPTEDTSAEIMALEAEARSCGVRIWRGGPGDMRRMGRGPDADRAVALIGHSPSATLDELLSRGGMCWLLHRASYPSNVGFAIRTAEVSGADGVIVDAVFNHEQRGRISHVSMGAADLLPVVYTTTEEALALAAQRGVHSIAIEDSGTSLPWEVDLRAPSVCIIGNEQTGIDAELIARCDFSVRIPMAGFVPSYNVQAAMTAIAVERLRQLGFS